MYRLKPGLKQDPERRWALPDRIFFGHGACRILAGTYLNTPPLAGFYAERIIPKRNLKGNHVYVTDGHLAFDYHGYSLRQRLLDHHVRNWSGDYDGWDYDLERVTFDLLSTSDLNARKMLGPDQYLYDAQARAERFISRVDHTAASEKAKRLSS